jgi:4-hydroxy-tetrahydrodipicolinate synthase
MKPPHDDVPLAPRTRGPLKPRSRERFGLSCASITPLDAEGLVDDLRLVGHLQRCLREGCSSFTLFGTTGEGSSIDRHERERTMERVFAALDPSWALVGVMANAPRDAAEQARPLLEAGGLGVLLAPPSYFKGPGDEGLYAWFSRTLDAMASPRGVFLYHLPSVTAVPLSLELIDRLKRAYPGVIAGVKDSSGDWPYTKALLERHADLHVLVGDERLLARAVREGGSGAINGFSNFCAARLVPMVERGEDAPAVSALVDVVLRHPVTPAIKVLVAHRTGDPAFARAAPPLATLTGAGADEVVAAYAKLGFA